MSNLINKTIFRIINHLWKIHKLLTVKKLVLIRIQIWKMTENEIFPMLYVNLLKPNKHIHKI